MSESIAPTPGEQKARRKAMQLLEFRDRTENELHDRLLKAGFTEDETKNALDYVRSFGYLNDERFAANYIYGRMTVKSRQKILQELAQKGIDRETAQQAWEETEANYDIDEREILRETVLRKVSPGTVLDEKKLRSLYGFLGRRGFRFEDISAVLRELEITREPYRFT